MGVAEAMPGVRQLAAAFAQANLLAVQWSAVLGQVGCEQARRTKAAASCRTPERLRRWAEERTFLCLSEVAG